MRQKMARLSAGLFVCLAAAAHAEAPAVPVTSLERACELLGGRLQSVGVQNCLHAGLKAGTDASVRGQPILYRDFVPRSLHAPPHRILMLGGIHGDELTSVALVFQWMKQLQQERFQPFHWRVIPCLNPDGLLSNPPVRVNADGVDLNRNFPSRDWNGTAISYWEKKARRDPRRYPGKAALSEPESRALTELIRTFKPEAIISVHAPYDVLDFDGPRHPPKHFGFLNLHQLGTYPGSLGNYAGVDLGLPVITLELPYAKIMPTPAQMQLIWEDMLTWLDKNLPKHEPPIYMRLGDQPWNE